MDLKSQISNLKFLIRDPGHCAGGCPETGSEPPPLHLAAHQVVGGIRAPGPGGVGRGGGGPRAVPGVEDRGDEPPGALDLVGPGEEGRVAEHDVEQEPLVGLGRRDGERGAVAEVHPDLLQPPPRAGDLRLEREARPLVGLDAQDQQVGAAGPSVLGLEERPSAACGTGSAISRGPLRQPLAGPEVERHARPPPGVQREPHRDERGRLRVGLDPLFLEVAGDFRPLDRPGGVLGPDDVPVHVLGRPDRAAPGAP